MYRALCDACIRRTSTGTLAGCPLLLMLWSFERFDIGRPALSLYEPYDDEVYVLNQFGEIDELDAPTMGTLWLSREPRWATDTGRGTYNAYVVALDQLKDDRVRWTPYTEDDINARAPLGLSELCYRDQALWCTKERLVFDIFVEPYCPERVARQFDRAQVFPLPRLELDMSHRYSRKGQGVAFEQSWVDKMVLWVNAWAQAGANVHNLGGPFDEGTYREYLHWFHRATRVRCFPTPVEATPHEAKITDTFAAEPPAAFNALIDICNDVGNELVLYAQRFEQTPSMVDTVELFATLRRLGQRCLAGVRRASCYQTTNIAVDVHQGVPPPPPPPPVVGSRGRSGPSQQRVSVLDTRSSCSDYTSNLAHVMTQPDAVAAVTDASLDSTPPPPPPPILGFGGRSDPSQHRVPVLGAHASCRDYMEGTNNLANAMTQSDVAAVVTDPFLDSTSPPSPSPPVVESGGRSCPSQQRIPVLGTHASCSDYMEGTSSLDHAMVQPDADANAITIAAAMIDPSLDSISAPSLVEWPKGGVLTRDWVAGLASTLDQCSRHLPPDSLPAVLPATLVQRLVLAATAILHREPNLVRVDPRPDQVVVVIGDVHGQLHDVIFLLRDAGFPSEDRIFVFNGDYVDRGAWGLETFLLLLAWKVLLPNCVFLLRGNHESQCCTSVYGFKEEVMTKYKDEGHQVYETFLECFKELPLATIIAGSVYTTHGGLFRGTNVVPSKRLRKRKKPMKLGSLQELMEARRTYRDSPDEKPKNIFLDVLWSDPSMEMGLSENERRNIGLFWGPDVTEQFLQTNHLKLIIRSHEGPDARDKRHDLLGMDNGYTVDHQVECGKLITLFSAPDYPQFQASEERYNNRGAYVVLNPPDFATPDFHSFEAVKPRPAAHPYYKFKEVADSDEELDYGAVDSDMSSEG